MILFGAALIGLAGLVADSALTVNLFSDVNGACYRVAVRSETFSGFKKATVVPYTIEERDAQWSAVRHTTGCEPADELGSVARLRGKLKFNLKC